MTTNTLKLHTLVLMAFSPFLGLIPAQMSVAQEQPSNPAANSPRRVAPQLVPPAGAPPAQLPPQHDKMATRIIPFKYADPNDLINVLQLFGVQVIANESPKAVVLSGFQSAVDLAEDAVEQLDVPPPPVKNVEVILYLVVAAKQGSALQELEPCGPQLAPVTDQLESVFGFQTFGQIDTLLLRGRDGSEVQASGFLPPLHSSAGTSEEAPSDYRVQVDELQVQTAPDGSSRISLNGFTFGTMLTIPSQSPNPNRTNPPYSRRDMGVSADLDVQEGQMAVVGKANLSMQGDVVFVVVTAHVVPE